MYPVLEIEQLCYGLLGIVQAAYNIGGHVISANAIEQSIFGFRSTRNGWVLTLFSLKNQNQILDFSCI